MVYVLLIIGFMLLIKGADFAVSGGSGLAEHFRISPVIIGLTVIAFGTSLPEMAVSVTGSLTGQSGIAVGNVVGSNIFNLLLVGGASLLFHPIAVNEKLLRRDFPISLLAALFIVAFALRPNFLGEAEFTIGRFGGVLLLFCFAGFMFLLIREAKQERAADCPPCDAERGLLLNLVFTFGGLVAIVFGSELVVDSAKEIAYSFGFSETFVGLTVVSIGTSLPELVTSVVAAKKGQNEIAMGNIVGSNIFNLLLVLGIAATIAPVAVPSYLLIDGIILSLITILAMALARKEQMLKRSDGIIFLIIYIVYFIYIFNRG